MVSTLHPFTKSSPFFIFLVLVLVKKRNLSARNKNHMLFLLPLITKNNGGQLKLTKSFHFHKKDIILLLIIITSLFPQLPLHGAETFIIKINRVFLPYFLFNKITGNNQLVAPRFINCFIPI